MANLHLVKGHIIAYVANRIERHKLMECFIITWYKILGSRACIGPRKRARKSRSSIIHSTNGRFTNRLIEGTYQIQGLCSGYVREYPYKIWHYMVWELHLRALRFPFFLLLQLWPKHQGLKWNEIMIKCLYPFLHISSSAHLELFRARTGIINIGHEL